MALPLPAPYEISDMNHIPEITPGPQGQASRVYHGLSPPQEVAQGFLHYSAPPPLSRPSFSLTVTPPEITDEERIRGTY